MTENERVRALRKAQGLTLEEFGAKIGVGRTAISKIERAERSLTNQNRLAICREFNVSETWLRTGEGEMFIPQTDDALDTVLERYGLPLEMRGLFVRYGKLSQQAKEEVRKMIREWAAELAEETTDTQTMAAPPAEEPEEQTPEEYARALSEEVYWKALQEKRRESATSILKESGNNTA